MDLANDPRRRATSDDPAWKYGFWPDLERKDLLQCTLCGKIVHGGVRRLKQHFSGGSSDADKCPEASMEIRIVMPNSLTLESLKLWSDILMRRMKLKFKCAVLSYTQDDLRPMLW